MQTVTKDVDFFKFAAHIHEINESWQKAIACWEQVKKLSPNDQDANRQINALSAAGTIKRAGLEDTLDQAGGGRSRRRAGRVARAKLERLKQEQLTPEQRLIKEIMADPTAVHAYVELAEIYRKRGDLDKAEKVLAKGRKANPDDHGLASIYEDTQISRLRKARDSQQQRVQQYPEDTGAKAKLDQLNEMLNKYEIEAFRRRVAASSRGRQAAFRPGRDPGARRRSRRRDRRISAGALEHQSHTEDPGPLSSGAELRGQQRRPSWRSATTKRPSSCSSPTTRITSSRSTTGWAVSPRRWAITRPPKSTTTRSPPSITRISTSPSG